MQKNLRRLIAVLLVIATVASFSSCNLIMRFLFEEEGETPIGDEVSFAKPDYDSLEEDDDSATLIGQALPSDETEGETAEAAEFEAVNDYATLIKKWDLYRCFGNCCDSKYTEKYFDGQDADYGYINYLIPCCATLKQIKQHIYHYMDKSLFEVSDAVSYFWAGESLYFTVLIERKSNHNADQIEILDESNPSAVKIKAYNYNNNEKIGHTIFAIDTTGSYKIMAAEYTEY